MEETYYVTFNESDEVITKISTECDEINFNENRSFPDDEFLVPKRSSSQSSSNDDYLPYVHTFDPLSTNNIIIPDIVISLNPNINLSDKSPELSLTDDYSIQNEPDDAELANNHNDVSEPQNITSNDNLINEVGPSPTIISPLTEVNLDTPTPQDRWSKDKYILLVNILGEPQAGVTRRSRVRDSEATSAHECLYVNFISDIEPKKAIEDLEEE
ncbi:hypothetical protein Tco_1276177 [Tanacetum coccineum]